MAGPGSGGRSNIRPKTGAQGSDMDRGSPEWLRLQVALAGAAR